MENVEKELIREYRHKIAAMNNEEFCKEWANVVERLKSIPNEKVTKYRNNRKTSAGVSFGI